jgi:hypothetical protein
MIFFRYVNGKWYDSVPIPHPKPGWRLYVYELPNVCAFGILDISQSKNPAEVQHKGRDFMRQVWIL